MGSGFPDRSIPPPHPTPPHPTPQALEAQEEQLDAELTRLDRVDEDELEALRRERLAGMKRSAEQRATWMAAGHGEYREIHDQKQFFEDLKKEHRAVVHFYRPSNRKCDLVDKALGALARKHIEAKFVRVDAEKAPFLAEKLKIWMLPTVVLIKAGRTEHSIVGLDEVGGDATTPESFEAVLVARDTLMEAYV